MPFLFPRYFQSFELYHPTVNAPGWYMSSDIREKRIAWVSLTTQYSFRFGCKIDCQLACDALLKVGYNTEEKMKDADELEVLKIVCENLRW